MGASIIVHVDIDTTFVKHKFVNINSAKTLVYMRLLFLFTDRFSNNRIDGFSNNTSGKVLNNT